MRGRAAASRVQRAAAMVTTPTDGDLRRSGAALFALEAGPYGAEALRVVSFRGREAMSRPYRWDVVVDVSGVDFDALEADLLARPASLEYTAEGSSRRVVHGVVSALRRVDTSRDGATRRVRLRLVPRLALLSRRRMSRIFQGATVPEIVSEILSDAGVASAQRLLRRYPVREYCVQYEETDLAFVTRLLAEEGIFFYFLQAPWMRSEARDIDAVRAIQDVAGATAGDASEVLVLGDHVGAYPAIAAGGGIDDVSASGRAPALWVRGDGEHLVEEHHVARFTRQRVVKPQASLLRDYDFRHPGVDLTAAQSARAVAAVRVGDGVTLGFDDLLALRVGAGAPRREGDDPVDVDPRRATVYAHHGEDGDPEVTRAAAHARLEQERRGVVLAAGRGWCRRLSVGHRFSVEGHVDDALNGEYVAAEVRHVGRTGAQSRRGAERAAYECAFVCVPSSTPFRPAPPRVVRRQVLETARVVGPPGEEVYTDPHGRIRVQFHWDLMGRGDERSSCWIRVSQAWAGPHWGTLFVPRVGMEVIVGFVGGDLDRPTVLGCLYNGENVPPFTLPGEKTRSGVRTQSSPGGGGHNELSFEDAREHEQVYLHAQRDLDEVVRNDHSVHVGRDEALEVERDRRTRVHRHSEARVDGDREDLVGGVRSVTTQGDVRVVTHGAARHWNGGTVETHTEGRARHLHESAVDEELLGERTVRARGCVTTIVGTPDARRHHGLVVDGTAEQYTTRETVLRSDTEVSLRCGRSSILITPTAIELSAPHLLLHAGQTELRIDERTLSARATETLTARGDVSATIVGAGVHLTTPEALAAQGKEPPVTTLVMRDEGGRPMAGQRFRLTLDDGSVRTGFLDREGCCVLTGAVSGQVEFPDVPQVRR